MMTYMPRSFALADSEFARRFAVRTDGVVVPSGICAYRNPAHLVGSSFGFLIPFRPKQKPNCLLKTVQAPPHWSLPPRYQKHQHDLYISKLLLLLLWPMASHGLLLIGFAQLEDWYEQNKDCGSWDFCQLKLEPIIASSDRNNSHHQFATSWCTRVSWASCYWAHLIAITKPNISLKSREGHCCGQLGINHTFNEWFVGHMWRVTFSIFQRNCKSGSLAVQTLDPQLQEDVFQELGFVLLSSFDWN